MSGPQEGYRDLGTMGQVGFAQQQVGSEHKRKILTGSADMKRGQVGSVGM